MQLCKVQLPGGAAAVGALSGSAVRLFNLSEPGGPRSLSDVLHADAPAALAQTLHVVGYTAGNDMSSRDIEGENPLYLPQAKVYDGSCALGPVVTLAGALPPREQVAIRLTITRAGTAVFEGATTLAAMKRSFE